VKNHWGSQIFYFDFLLLSKIQFIRFFNILLLLKHAKLITKLITPVKNQLIINQLKSIIKLIIRIK
jgi:hypothetical protein